MFAKEYYPDDITSALTTLCGEETSAEAYNGIQNAVYDLLAVCENDHNENYYRDLYKVLEGITKQVEFRNIRNSQTEPETRYIDFLYSGYEIYVSMEGYTPTLFYCDKDSRQIYFDNPAMIYNHIPHPKKPEEIEQHLKQLFIEGFDFSIRKMEDKK